MSMPNFQHRSLGSFARRMGFASIAAGFLSSLADCILHIVTAGSDKKMIWSHTGRIVAVMANMESFRNCSEVDFPRCTVRSNANVAACISNISITARLTSRPNPTRFHFSNKFPKSICKGYAIFRLRMIAGLGTKLSIGPSIRGKYALTI